MVRKAERIADAEADDLFDGLERFARLVVAVSGGADSLALLHLLASWTERLKPRGPELAAVTIDHGLRPQSAAEAHLVAEAARALDIRHATLTWDEAKPASGVPAAAREARYRLLDAFAREEGVGGAVALLTAHHAGDQAETLLMRLKRGAGIDGLSAIAARRPAVAGSPVTLVRPLLAIPKARLVATLEELGATWIEDPTNAREDLERTRVRALLARLADDGLAEEALARSAARLADAREAVDYGERRFRATLSLDFHGGVFAALDRAAFAAGPRLLRARVLADLIAKFGGASPRAELAEIEALVKRLDADAATAATLGGAIVSAGAKCLKVWREAGRLPLEPLQLASGESAIWDRRFRVTVAAETCGPLDVLPLGAKGIDHVEAELGEDFDVPARALATLPAFWSGPDFVGAPALAGVLRPGIGPAGLNVCGHGRVGAAFIYGI